MKTPEGPNPKPRVCIIDDDHEVIEHAVRVFAARGLLVLPISQPIGSANQIRAFNPDLIVLDLMMPAIDGGELLGLLRRLLKKLPPVVLYSGIDPEELRRVAENYEVAGHVYKGDGPMRLLGEVNLHLAASARNPLTTAPAAGPGARRSQEP